MSDGLGSGGIPDAAGIPVRSDDGYGVPDQYQRSASGPAPKRTSEQIRTDMDARRMELSRSVDTLRDKVVEVTDWRSQLRRHRKQILVGAVATGFVVGGLMALRRR
jgi:dienelactone hydrolase